MIHLYYFSLIYLPSFNFRESKHRSALHSLPQPPSASTLLPISLFLNALLRAFLSPIQTSGSLRRRYKAMNHLTWAILLVSEVLPLLLHLLNEDDVAVTVTPVSHLNLNIYNFGSRSVTSDCVLPWNMNIEEMQIKIGSIFPGLVRSGLW